MKNIKERAKNKEWKKIIGYAIPIIALVVANAMGIENELPIENSLGILFTAILGVLASIGVVKNNDKTKHKTKK